MDNENEIQDSQPVEPVVEKTEPTLEDYNELASKNKELYARLKKVEAKAKEAKLVSAPNTPAEDPKIMEKLSRIELKTEGYSDEEIDFIMPLGGKKALENKRVVAGIEALRQQAKAEAATVDTDSAKSDIEKKYTNDQLSKMSSKELEALLPKA